MHIPTMPAISADPSSLRDLLHTSNGCTLIAAHRGFWRAAPENSLAALRAAIDEGADIVELDVRATSDGVLVLLHDPTLDRTSSASGRVADTHFSALRGAVLKMGSGTGQPLVAGELLPTLSQALEVARDRIAVNLDIKATAQTEAISRLVIASGMAAQVFVKAQIDSEADVARIRAHPLFGRVAFVPMIHARPGQFIGQLRSIAPLRPPMYEVSFAALDDLREGLPELRRQGARLWVNTIEASYSADFHDRRALQDPDGVWGALLDCGVGAIQTDEVRLLCAYLAGRGAR